MSSINPSIANKAWSLVRERRLPWRIDRWLYRRRLETARRAADTSVLETRPYATGRDSAGFEVHVLLSTRHVGMTLWSVKSLLHQSGRQFHVVLHDDGTLSQHDVDVLEDHLPGVSVIRRAWADKQMHALLGELPNCMKYRFSPKETTDHRGIRYDMHLFALRLFDFNLLTQAKKTLVLDCDVLFFKRPQEILDWIDDPVTDGSLYSIEQYVPMYNARYEVAGYRRKTEDPTDGNAGLLCFDKRAYDLEAIDEWIGRNSDRMDKLATFEQHAYNHLLRRHGVGKALPDSYAFNYTDGSVTATHFAIKHLFFNNLPRLEPILRGDSLVTRVRA